MNKMANLNDNYWYDQRLQHFLYWNFPFFLFIVRFYDLLSFYVIQKESNKNKIRFHIEKYHNKNGVKIIFYKLFTEVGNFTKLTPTPSLNIRMDRPWSHSTVLSVYCCRILYWKTQVLYFQCVIITRCMLLFNVDASQCFPANGPTSSAVLNGLKININGNFYGLILPIFRMYI